MTRRSGKKPNAVLEWLRCALCRCRALREIENFPLGNGSWRGECITCGKQWAVNPAMGVAVRWSDEFAEFYRSMGFGVKP